MNVHDLTPEDLETAKEHFADVPAALRELLEISREANLQLGTDMVRAPTMEDVVRIMTAHDGETTERILMAFLIGRTTGPAE